MTDLYKRYVEVITLINKEGQLTPLYLIWEGRTYKIDKVTNIRKSVSAVGGCGICYTCLIEGRIRKLFWEQYRWFLESYKP